MAFLFPDVAHFMEIVTPPFITEYGFRPNRLFVEFLGYPREVFSMLFGGHLLAVIISLAGIVLSFRIGWQVFGQAIRAVVYPPKTGRAAMALFILAFGIMGVRSTFGHRPMNPAMVAFVDDALVNSIVLNSMYSVGFAIYNMKSEADASKIYGHMPEEDIIKIVRAETLLPASAFTNRNLPTLHHQEATYRGKTKNLVIILEERLGARYVGSLGGLPLTPNLDALAQKGWMFDRLYATGTRSVRGIEAVVSSFTPTLLSLMGVDNENPMPGRDMSAQPENCTGRALMQYGMNLAYMEGDGDVVILQQGFTYDFKSRKLTSGSLKEGLPEKALAMALWGSLAYQKQLYRLPAE